MNTAESAWSKFTDDFKYILQDFGTSPEPEDMVNQAKAALIGLTLIINCELNLDTGVRKIINGTYIYTQ
jgi:hypothetical protein